MDVALADSGRGRVIYSNIAQNLRLREHLQSEEKRTELDNLDGEIVLLRAMLKILVEKYGEKVVDLAFFYLLDRKSSF
mgnify:CR=1 FL=1